MPSHMISCPHCGTVNSAAKRVCHHCHGDLSTLAHPVERRKIIVRNGAAPTVKTVVRNSAPPAPSTLTTTSLAQRAQFYRKLQTQIKAGIPLIQGLHFIQRNVPTTFLPVISHMINHSEGGGQFHVAMASFPRLFPPWEVHLMQSAELSGTLPEMLGEIAESLELELTLRTQVRSETLFAQITAWVFILVLLIFINVKIAANAPGIETNTQALANAMHYVGRAILEFGVIVATVNLLIWGWRIVGRHHAGMVWTQEIVMRVPMIGPIMRDIMRLRFLSALSALWRSGVAPIQALETAAQATGNPRIISQVSALMTQLGQRATVAGVLEPLHLFPPEVISMVSIGETSGRVSESLDQVSDYLRSNMTGQAKALPFKAYLIIFFIVAILVGWLVCTVFPWYFNQLFDRI